MTTQRIFVLVSFIHDSPQDLPQTLFQGFNGNLFRLLPVIFHLAAADASVFIHGSGRDALRGRGLGVASPNFGIISSRQLPVAIDLTAAHYNRLILITTFPVADVFGRNYALPPNVLHGQLSEDGYGPGYELLKEHTSADRSTAEFRTHPQITLAGHNIILPNASILQAAGISVDLPSFVSPFEEDYVTEIVKSVEAVENLRASLNLPLLGDEQPFGTKLIIAASGVSRSWALQKKLDTRGFPPDKAKALRYIAKHILHPDSYSSPATPDINLLLQDDDLRPEVRTSIMLRAPELKIFTAALALLASTSLAPAIRLPPRINKIRSELRDAQFLDERGLMGREEAIRLSATVRSMGEKMRASVPARLLDVIERTTGHIKFVADVPLELMPSAEGFPLVLKNTTSRLSVTPGDLLLKKSWPHAILHPDNSGLKQITVIRSYEFGDPIKPLAEGCMRKMCPVSETGVSVNFVDVSTASDFSDAVNSCESEIVVYDGHGVVDSKTGNSFLALASGRVNTFDLKAKLSRAPAIMLLLACSTHPLDGSHVSVANGILSWRTATVIGTLGPVSGPSAALLFCRFINWLSGVLVPYLQAEQDGAVSWVEAFAGFQRRCYINDLLLALIDHSDLKIGASQLAELQKMGNSRASGPGNWLALFIHDIAGACGADEAEVKANWQKFAYFSESLKYVQMGRPETILLLPRRIGTA